ncbi:MAG: hypothetical protein P4L41_17980 [Flavipsychrobacter sp.]|nr:hypothetical protein [Flavipsychrobacter sp.]
MKISKKFLLLIAVAGIFSLKAIAQGTIPNDPDEAVPLDGGLSIAIVAGVSYGAKRLMKKKQAAAEAAKETTEK